MNYKPTEQEISEAMNDNSITPQWMRRCKMCGITFETMNKKLKHMESDEHQQTRCRVMGIVWEEPAPIRCDVCDMEFKTESNLRNHLKNSKNHRKRVCDKWLCQSISD